MNRQQLASITRAADALLASTDNPLHRKILKNYRRHALLEVSGRWAEILTPEMTVEQPVYRLTEGAGTTVLEGRDAVLEFYRSLADAGAIVMGPVEEQIMVGDWGFASECMFHHFIPGKALAASGAELADDEAVYLVKHRLAFVWPYDPSGRLIGEHVYEDIASRTMDKVPPAEVITPAEAAEILKPLLDDADLEP